ncbi:hypothetical protein QYE76_028777 [Lolium multiflorum]|uniref:CCHC-type domain-containing protein n=1 Tax=Lolium multiflorum TaxID=4521 RepID=A0AAD8VG30_LOLMU|nr:hypothetical protein QYE76_028777 [Lolium multiflorum]
MDSSEQSRPWKPRSPWIKAEEQNTNPDVQQDRRALDVMIGSTMENNLEVAGVEAAEASLPPTTWDSVSWWTSAAMNGTNDDWEDFKLKFSKYHVPQGLIKKMRDEFRELKEGCPWWNTATVSHSVKNGPHHTQKYRNNSSGGFTPRHNKPPAQSYRPNYTNNNGGPPKPGGNNNNNHNNNNNNGNNSNTNTAPRTGSNATPVTPKDKATINYYECGVVGHYSNECPKKLAKIAANTAAPAQQQRRKKEPNNNNGRLYHMNAIEAGSTPDHAKYVFLLIKMLNLS